MHYLASRLFVLFVWRSVALRESVRAHCHALLSYCSLYPGRVFSRILCVSRLFFSPSHFSSSNELFSWARIGQVSEAQLGVGHHNLHVQRCMRSRVILFCRGQALGTCWVRGRGRMSPTFLSEHWILSPLLWCALGILLRMGISSTLFRSACRFTWIDTVSVRLLCSLLQWESSSRRALNLFLHCDKL